MMTEQTKKKPGMGTIRRMGTILHVLWKHRQYGLLLIWMILGPFFYIFTRACLILDHVFFPSLRKTKLTQPVFIMGHPRSGTTYFQKQIYKTGQVTMFSTWDMLFPSLVQRKIFAPVLWLLKRLNINVLQSAQKGHEIRLEEVEEDEGLFLHRLDTEMVTILAPWLLIDDEYGDAGFRLGWNDARQNYRSLKFFSACLKRQILHTGKQQVVAKANPSIFRIESILDVFPDAKIVYIIRAPHHTMRSFLSFTNKFVGPVLSKNEQEEFFQKKYEWSVELYQYFEDIKSSIPEDQLLILPFEEIVSDINKSLDDFFSFADIQVTNATWEKIREEQKSDHKKSHTNEPLENFGISHEDIRDDLDFIWKQYLNNDAEQPKNEDPSEDPSEFTP